ncbi:MAG: biopolymer transporter ExbD [Verrucomicrobiota bacterium]|nr:biopolymer transporter ExbD [Limisphaera sp.]MDW8382818.1 biopolymer transporter ExbD [Verrucomicrobiota bacterium]
MRFPITVKPFTGQWDVAAWAGALLILMMFVLLLPLVPTPGIRWEIPMADNLPGVAEPLLPVAVDGENRFYFRNQLMDATTLLNQLRQEVRQYDSPPALVVHADRRTSYETLVRLSEVAQQAGLNRMVLAIQPRPGKSPHPSRPVGGLSVP